MKTKEEEQQKPKSTKNIFPRDQRNNKIYKELDQTKKVKEQTDREDFTYEINIYLSSSNLRG